MITIITFCSADKTGRREISYENEISTTLSSTITYEGLLRSCLSVEVIATGKVTRNNNIVRFHARQLLQFPSKHDQISILHSVTRSLLSTPGPPTVGRKRTRSRCRHCAFVRWKGFFRFPSSPARDDYNNAAATVVVWTPVTTRVTLPPIPRLPINANRVHWTAESRSPAVVPGRRVPPLFECCPVACTYYVRARAQTQPVPVASACVPEDRILWPTARTRTIRHDDPRRLLLPCRILSARFGTALLLLFCLPSLSRFVIIIYLLLLFSPGGPLINCNAYLAWTVRPLKTAVTMPFEKPQQVPSAGGLCAVHGSSSRGRPLQSPFWIFLRVLLERFLSAYPLCDFFLCTHILFYSSCVRDKRRFLRTRILLWKKKKGTTADVLDDDYSARIITYLPPSRSSYFSSFVLNAVSVSSKRVIRAPPLLSFVTLNSVCRVLPGSSVHHTADFHKKRDRWRTDKNNSVPSSW